MNRHQELIYPYEIYLNQITVDILSVLFERLTFPICISLYIKWNRYMNWNLDLRLMLVFVLFYFLSGLLRFFTTSACTLLFIDLTLILKISL